MKYPNGFIRVRFRDNLVEFVVDPRAAARLEQEFCAARAMCEKTGLAKFTIEADVVVDTNPDDAVVVPVQAAEEV